LLCDTLWLNEIFGKPDEYFCKEGVHPDYSGSEPPSNYSDYIQRVKSLATGRNGVGGAKIMWNHFILFLHRCRKKDSLEGLGDYEVLQQVFPDVRFIWLTRRDKIRQAISMYKWKMTGITSNRDPAHYQTVDIPFNCESIRDYLLWINDCDQQWGTFFKINSIDPLRLVYEDYVDHIERVIEDTANYLGIQIPDVHQFAYSTYRKLRDPVSEQWAEWYLETGRGH